MDADPFFGLSVHASPVLAGGKKAVRRGSKLFVSPAMYDLISHAAPDELKLLLEQIECVNIPETPGPFGFVPVTRR